jgi:amino acid adenylation domain-containing protein
MNETTDQHATPAEDLLAQQLYWLNTLAGELPDTTLFASDARAACRTPVFEQRVFELPPDVAEKIFKLTKGAELSTYVVLVSALAGLIHRYTGREDMIIGSPVYRPDADRAPANALVPLRARLSGDVTFKEHLLRTKQTVLDAYSNQDFPLAKIAELLGGEGRQPLVNVSAALEGIHGRAHTETATTGDVSFNFANGGPAISATVTFNANVYGAAIIDRLTKHYANFLRGVLADINRKVSEVSLLTDEERRALLFEFNDKTAAFDTERGFTSLFETRVRETPDAVAVTEGGSFVTYRELNARANRMARSLRDAGARPEQLVALFAERGTDYLTAILGIFKAGAAYLPLDITAPPQRLSRVVARSRCSLLLVSRSLLLAANDLLPELQQALDEAGASDCPPIMLLDELWAGDGDPGDLPACVRPDNLAYVIYTSGSTGEPKGAMVEQRGMINHLLAKVADLKIGRGDVVAQTAPPSFDISVWQFLAPLLAGARVLIARDEEARDPRLLPQLLARESVTIFEAVPTLLRAVFGIAASAAALPPLPALRWLLATGEELPVALCRDWLAQYPHAHIVNAYGPTECSDDVTHGFIAYAPDEFERRAPIGLPVANLQIYVLDEWQAPVPQGVAGELHVGGVGVGRGYVGDGARTAEAFVPDSLSGASGARLYRTGDLARHRGCSGQSGGLEYLGRVDRQLKVRGYRIEPGELETALLKHPAVREAAVVAREGAAGGGPRLVAYVVVAEGQEVASWELRAHMQGLVAEPVVPQAFITLAQMPLTPGGKINRRALPEPDLSQMQTREAYIAPRNSVEEEVAKIFAGILNVERVGVRDNFFELGGHSLAATELALKVREAFNVELPLRQFFAEANVEQVARAVEEKLLEQVEELSEEAAEQWLAG